MTATALVSLFLLLAVPQVLGLPWEDVVLDADREDLLRSNPDPAKGVRGLNAPPCPIHPKPVAQQFISPTVRSPVSQNKARPS
jgi:hypothetical protein